MKNKGVSKIKRDRNIAMSYTREISLCAKSIEDKTKYKRKSKHKNKDEYSHKCIIVNL